MAKSGRAGPSCGGRACAVAPGECTTHANTHKCMRTHTHTCTRKAACPAEQSHNSAHLIILLIKPGTQKGPASRGVQTTAWQVNSMCVCANEWHALIGYWVSLQRNCVSFEWMCISIHWEVSEQLNAIFSSCNTFMQFSYSLARVHPASVCKHKYIAWFYVHLWQLKWIQRLISSVKVNLVSRSCD